MAGIVMLALLRSYRTQEHGSVSVRRFMLRNIIHIGIPDFYTAVEELRRPELKKHPLVLAEPGERSIIQSVNRIAGKEGITAGMPLSHARRLCRRIQVIPSDYYYYRERHQEIIRDFGRFSPLVEGIHPGGYFIDITGTRRLWGPEPDIACRIEADMSEKVGLHARIGLASNKLVSQVAANCIEPGDLSCIFPGNEGAFLAPLPVDFLPGVGQITTSRLEGFNIRKIGQLASLPFGVLAGVFGKAADRLLKIAKGIDPAPVLPSLQPPRLLLAKTLDRDEIDLMRLEAILFRQVEEAGWTLRSHNRCPGHFRLEIRYADGMSVEGRKRLSNEIIQADRWLFRSIFPVFLQLFQRRVAVRRLILEFSDLSMPFRQLSLFSWEKRSSPKDRDLQKVLDVIRLKFGKSCITWGKTLN